MIANHNIDHSTMQSDDDARLLHLVLELNRAITRSVSSTDLFENICRIIDLYEEFPICWVGQPDMRTRNFNPIATTNLSKQDLHVLQTSKFEDGGPTKKSLERNGHIIFVNDISTENKSSPLIKFCNDRGIRSFLTIPFSGNDHVVYNLNLCSTRAEAFSDVRLSLFNGLAEDLSYALANLNEKDARKNLEAALNEKTKVFERSEAISRSGSFKVDIKRRTCVWSLEGRRIFDFHISETEILYSDWVDTILPDDLERVRSKMYLAIEETTVADIVYRIRIKNGSIRHIRSIAAFERNENNEPISMYCAITDITKQTEISSDLSKAQHNLASILDSIPLAVALKNRSGAYDYANQKFADLFGVSANKLIKLKAEEIARSYPKNEVLTEMDRDVFENGVVVQKNEI